MADMTPGRVTAVMVDTDDLDVVIPFWTKVLGLEVKYRDERFAYLSDLSSGGPHLAFQKVPEPKEGKNRLHLDMMVEDREAFAEWVEELGGSVIEQQEQPGFPIWIVMSDPQGNEFCIFEKPEDSA